MKISISSGRFFFFVLILVSSSIILVRCNTLAGRIGGLSDAEMKELESHIAPESRTQFENDLSDLENAIEQEIVDDLVAGKEQQKSADITPKELDDEVKDHHEQEPWYQRLVTYLQDNLPSLVMKVAKAILKEFVLPSFLRNIFDK